jgi:hypothetical protein
MVFVRRFERLGAGRVGWRSEVECGWHVGTHDGKRVLRLESYGSEHRQNRDKASQALELDAVRARELQKILIGAFPELT